MCQWCARSSLTLANFQQKTPTKFTLAGHSDQSELLVHVQKQGNSEKWLAKNHHARTFTPSKFTTLFHCVFTHIQV